MTGFIYKSYSFIDKDPIIDQIRTIVQESGKTYTWIHENSNVSFTTIRNMLDGGTKRPQAATINAILRCLGYKLDIRLVAELSVVTPTVFIPKPPRGKTSYRHQNVIAMQRHRKRKKVS